MKLEFYEIDYTIERLEDGFKIYDNGDYHRLYDDQLIFDDWFITYSNYLPFDKDIKKEVICWVNSFKEEL